MQERLETIRRRVVLLARCDRARQVFGAATHGYALAPALDPAAASAFEERHGVALPESYRAFLTRIANGGAGPYYGLSPLAPMERQELPQQHVTITGADGALLAQAGTGPRAVPDVVSSLARPFPLAAPWKPADGRLPIPPGTSPYDGAVHLAEIGCGYFAFLVVRGPGRGQVWVDYTAGDGAIAREHDDFLGWYEAWLDRAFVEWADLALPSLAVDEEGLREAAPLVEREAAASPPFTPALRRLGYLRILQGRHDDALESFEAAARASTEEPEARRRLDRARVYRTRGQHEAALTEARAGLEQEALWFSTQLELLRQTRDALVQLGRGDEARAVEEKIDELSPKPKPKPQAQGWAKQGGGWKKG